jgi:hypothetical protein
MALPKIRWKPLFNNSWFVMLRLGEESRSASTCGTHAGFIL